MQVNTCLHLIVQRTIGACRGLAARGRPQRG